MVRNTHLHKGFYICDREFTEGCCVSYKKKVLCKSPFFFLLFGCYIVQAGQSTQERVPSLKRARCFIAATSVFKCIQSTLRLIIWRTPEGSMPGGVQAVSLFYERLRFIMYVHPKASYIDLCCVYFIHVWYNSR